MDQDFKGEKWRPIPGFCAAYQVSNYGRIYSVRRGKMLSPEILKNRMKLISGYTRVTLSIDNNRTRILVHRATARAWVPGRTEDKHVDHIDNNPTNNRAENLRYLTPEENLRRRHYPPKSEDDDLPF